MVSERLRPSATSPGTSRLVPKYRPPLEIAPGRGWPLLQHSPDALVVSRRSPECVTIMANLVPPHEMSSVLDIMTLKRYLICHGVDGGVLRGRAWRRACGGLSERPAKETSKSEQQAKGEYN